MDIQVGDQAIDYAQVAQKEKLSDLQLRIRQLVEQVEQIIKEQSYQRVNIIKFMNYKKVVNFKTETWKV